jgi:hypothetical protein
MSATSLLPYITDLLNSSASGIIGFSPIEILKGEPRPDFLEITEERARPSTYSWY